MSLIETESLVLRTYDLADADKIAVLLTRDHGVIRGVAKGAKRLKSKFGSGLEPFSIIRLCYLQKETSELVSIQKVELERSFFAVASDPEFLQKFSYLSDLLVTFSPPHDPNETLYRMAVTCLETAAGKLSTLAAIGVYFEIWVLRLAGYMPDWSRCNDCGRAFDEREDARLGGNMHLMCTRCRRSGAGLTVPAGQRSLPGLARRLSPAEFAYLTGPNGRDLKDISLVLKRMISHSIGREIGGETSLVASGG